MRPNGAAYGVLVTGASGYLGSLIVATLLVNEDVQLVLPVRHGNDFESLLAPIEAEIEIQGRDFDPAYRERVHVVDLPPLESLDRLAAAVREFDVKEIIHSAGCLDYFDRSALEAVNVNFTRLLLEQARRWEIERFIYISTAFSSGYIDTAVPEQLHNEPSRDPTEYTRTKRQAEWLVARSGLAYLILRPSIVIGDSRDGHYSGKQYGLYQLWSGMERLLCKSWSPDIHALAPMQPISLVHQDAFQNAFLAAFRILPDGAILNMVSEHEEQPDLRSLWQLWIKSCLRPQVVFYYSKMSDIPLREINTKQRALLGLASVNLEIASHPWRFDTTNLNRLRQKGLEFPETTLDSVAICQSRFVEESATIQQFIAQSSHEMKHDFEFFEMPMSEAATPAPSAL